MKKAFLIVLCFIAIPFISCLDDDNVNFHFVALQIVSAELPESFTLNESYDIKVTFIRPNDCILFAGFDISNPDITERNVVVIGSELENETCVQIADEVVESFRFTCIYTGTYVFKFWTGEDENGEQQYLEIEVPVNP